MQIVRGLDEQFARLHERSVRLVRAVPFEKLYRRPPQTESGRARAFPVYSCGEHILRSAAAVEQTFGGITVNLWDDPFEWTLPESMPAPSDVERYLEEAEATRARAFRLFKSDEDISKEIAAPSGEMRTLFALVVETLARASHHQGRAYATFRLFSDERLPPV
jgi:hypothetical protein